jgi:hypothetical protein
MGSDHDVYQDSSFGIPAIYLNDWPDRYIHTNFDTPANIDPTKLKRTAFIGAASGYFLAGLSSSEKIASLERDLASVQSAKLGLVFLRAAEVNDSEGANVVRQGVTYSEMSALSLYRFAGQIVGIGMTSPGMQLPGGPMAEALPPPTTAAGEGSLRFARKTTPKGPLAVFGYDFFADHRKTAGVAAPRLLSYEGLWGAGEEYAYEVLNFADGKRNAQEIRDAVSAEYGPVPVEMVVEYLRTLERVGVVEQVK